MNVEICTSVKAIKYIMKYVHKGYDCADLNIQVEGGEVIKDEIRTFQDARYVSAPQAIWRLM